MENYLEMCKLLEGFSVDLEIFSHILCLDLKSNQRRMRIQPTGMIQALRLGLLKEPEPASPWTSYRYRHMLFAPVYCLLFVKPFKMGLFEIFHTKDG